MAAAPSRPHRRLVLAGLAGLVAAPASPSRNAAASEARTELAWSAVLPPSLGVGRGVRRVPSSDGDVIAIAFRAGEPRDGLRLRIPFSRLDLPPERTRLTATWGVRFSPDFDFHQGGKLPGLAGGSAPTGCETPQEDGFSVRPMWRSGGAGELYVYPSGVRSAPCGLSLARGRFRFVAGRWHRLMLGVAFEPDGDLVSLALDGIPVAQARLRLRREPTTGVDTLLLHVFFGGSGEAAVSPRTQEVQLRDLSLAFGRGEDER